MTKQEKLQYCSGCEDDFYNDHNPFGIKECWSLKDASLILIKRVHVNEMPPWKREPERLFKCYQQKGYIFVDPKIER